MLPDYGDLMAFPSDEQKQIITHRGKPLVVVAAPGTGKTSTIVARIVGLLREDSGREVSFVTFTRTSRRDTEAKIMEAVGDEASTKTELAYPRVSTLHGFAKSLVHRYAEVIGRESRFSILVKERGEMDLVLCDMLEDVEAQVPLSELSKALSEFRSTDTWPQECEVENLEELLACFESMLALYNTFDIEGVVVAARRILSSNDVTPQPVFLQVDEYQDLNPADQDLVRCATRATGSQVVVVGDDAQSIYGFRHANPAGMRALWESDDWDHLRLTQCHRLPPHILLAAHDLIASAGYLGADVRLPEDTGGKIQVLQCTKSKYQMAAVAGEVESILRTKTRFDGSQLTLKDLMVLCPSNTWVKVASKALEAKYGISTRRFEKNKIPDDHWRLLLLLRILAFNDGLALRQWLTIANVPDQIVRQIRAEAFDAHRSFYAQAEQTDVPEIRDLFERLHRVRECEADAAALRTQLLEFPHLAVEESLFPEIGFTIDEALEEVPAISSIINSVYERYGLVDAEPSVPDEDRLLVTTLHSAKGLEAEYVFLMWMNDTFMPSPSRDIDEERRVLYVALTRAKQDVIVTFHERYDTASRRYLRKEAMSSFLWDIEDHLEFRRVTKADL